MRKFNPSPPWRNPKIPFAPRNNHFYTGGPKQAELAQPHLSKYTGWHFRFMVQKGHQQALHTADGRGTGGLKFRSHNFFSYPHCIPIGVEILRSWLCGTITQWFFLQSLGDKDPQWRLRRPRPISVGQLPALLAKANMARENPGFSTALGGRC